MEFENNGLGKCVVLKEDNEVNLHLVYAISSKQFIIASILNDDGSWLHGSYFQNNLDKALNRYNEMVN